MGARRRTVGCPSLPWARAGTTGPTPVFIDAMALLGLVSDRKRAINVWETRKARWEKTNGRPVCESITGPPLFKQRVITFGPHNYGAEDLRVLPRDGSGCDMGLHLPVPQCW